MNSTRAFIRLLLLILMMTGCSTSPPPAQPSSSNASRSSEQVQAFGAETEENSETVEVIEDETDDEDDEEEDDEEGNDDDADDDEAEDDDEEGSGTLLIFGKDTQDETAKISVRKKGGKWQDFAWPDDGKSVKVRSFCSDSGDTTIEVRTLTADGGAVLVGDADMDILETTSGKVTIGYEPTGCEGDKCQDDNVVELSCSDSDVVVESN